MPAIASIARQAPAPLLCPSYLRRRIIDTQALVRSLASPGLRLAASVLLAACSVDAQESAESFADPAAPTVHELPPVEAPAAKPCAELTTHRAARPLSENAIVEDWPGFLGPRRDGRSIESPLHLDWPAAGPALVWETTKGEGYASPVIAGEYLVLTHRIGDESIVDCLHPTTGQRYWRTQFPCEYRGKYIRNGGPRSTPQIAGEHVYVHGVQGSLRCLELRTGRLVWKREINQEFQIGDQYFGVVASPLLYDDLLIQNIGAPPHGPSVAAFERATGRIVWAAGDRWGPSCASPVVAAPFGRDLAYVMTGGESRPPSGGLMVLDARSGALQLEHPFRSRTPESVNGASPVPCDNGIFLTSSYGVGSTVLQLSEDGGFSERWSNRRLGFQFATPVFEDGQLWAIDGVADRAGALVAIDPESGAESLRTTLEWDVSTTVSNETVTRPESVGEGSLLWADGHLLCLGDTGLLLALRPGPEEVAIVAGVQVFHAREAWTPLVLSRGLLYVCQNLPGARRRVGSSPDVLRSARLRGPAPKSGMAFAITGGGPGGKWYDETCASEEDPWIPAWSQSRSSPFRSWSPRSLAP